MKRLLLPALLLINITLLSANVPTLSEEEKSEVIKFAKEKYLQLNEADRQLVFQNITLQLMKYKRLEAFLDKELKEVEEKLKRFIEITREEKVKEISKREAQIALLKMETFENKYTY